MRGGYEVRVAADPSLAPLVAEPGRVVVSTDGDLVGCAVVYLAGHDGWRRLRVLRGAGHAMAVVVVHPAEPPDDRAALEPVVHVRTPDRAALGAAARTVGGEVASSVVHLAGGRVDLLRAVFRAHGGDEVELTGLEVRFLGYLAARPGRVVDRDELQAQVWDHRRPVPTRAVDVAVARLRRKVEVGGARCLLTVRGGGYRLVTEREPAPLPAPGLVGRDALLGAIDAALAPPGAAVVLVGPPGVGKSALCRVLARRPGARLVDLDGAAGFDPVGDLAVRLGARLPPEGDRAGVLLAGLAGGLLVVDHAVDPALLLALLPGLATHGVRLVVADQVAPVAPGATTFSVPRLGSAEVATLLRLRAPQLSDADVTALVPFLDGLPLAVELAAVRAVLLGVEVMTDAVERLHLMSPSPDNTRRSLGAAIGRAWDRCDQVERDALTRLAAFQGPFRLPWARAQLGAEAVSHLAALASRHLVFADDGWYSVLPVVRTFVRAVGAPDADGRLPWLADHAWAALARLGRAGARAAHAELTELFPDAAAQLPRALPGEVGALASLIDVVLLATGTVAERERWLDLAVPLAAGDRGSRVRVGYLRAALQLNRAPAACAAALAALESHPDPTLRVQHVVVEVMAHGFAHGPASARSLLERLRPDTLDDRGRWRLAALAEVLEEQLGHQPPDATADHLEVLARSLLDGGFLADGVYVGVDAVLRLQVGDRARGALLLRELLAQIPALHDPRMVAQLHLTLGQERVLDGDPDGAAAAFDQAAALFERSEPVRLLQVDALRAGAHLAAGRHAEARAGYGRLATWARSVGNRKREEEARMHLAEVALDEGDAGRAVAEAEVAWTLARALGVDHDVTGAVLAMALLVAGDLGRCAEVLGTVDAAALTPWDRLQVAVVRVALGAPETVLRAALAEVGGEPGAAAAGWATGDAAAVAAARTHPSAEVRRLARLGDARSHGA